MLWSPRLDLLKMHRFIIAMPRLSSTYAAHFRVEGCHDREASDINPCVWWVRMKRLTMKSRTIKKLRKINSLQSSEAKPRGLYAEDDVPTTKHYSPFFVTLWIGQLRSQSCSIRNAWSPGSTTASTIYIRPTVETLFFLSHHIANGVETDAQRSQTVFLTKCYPSTFHHESSRPTYTDAEQNNVFFMYDVLLWSLAGSYESFVRVSWKISNLARNKFLVLHEITVWRETSCTLIHLLLHHSPEFLWGNGTRFVWKKKVFIDIVEGLCRWQHSRS